MWSNPGKNIPARGFSTPPASWKSPHSPAPIPMSERVPSGCRRYLFHVVHKVPAGDSPYVRAKHVQLIDKDPSRAISLFWAAINAGDRVDSALKDMAVVMKQLNRSDEAIEAIKSFRHLCPFDSQESLDNVLVELYKRSGRIEEEIEMLHRKLKSIEEGIVFGGKKTKIARSQGKKIQVTVEQERSRILGNLAWAYLQHHDYGLAEQYYRKAVSLEPDYNKQCNLAICLMHMNRIPEAKSLIQAVSDSCGSTKMDDSYTKSYERAVQLLTELDSKSVLKKTRDDKENHKSSASPATEMRDDGSLFSQQAGVDNDWRKASPAAVLYTQPRHVSWRFGEGDQTRGRLEEDRNKRPFENTLRNLDGELLDSTAEKSNTAVSKSQSSMFSPPERNWRGQSWSEVAQGKSTGAEALESFSQQRMSEASIGKEYEISSKMKPTDTVGDKSLGKNSSTKSAHKSWADMVEEEEKKLLTGEDPSPCFSNDWNYKEECNDENVDSNIDHQSPIETISQRLEVFDLKDNSYDTLSNSVSPRNPSVRRSLCFDGKKDFNMKKKSNRLQVFRDITPSQDSP